jgi:diguanylate cyclase (GGDEF)-like protein/PAS domain S-box-containing protein
MKEYSEDERIIERALFADKIVRLVLLPLLFGIVVVAYIKGIPYPLMPIVILLVTFYIIAQISLALIKRNFYPRRVFFIRLIIDVALIAIAVHYSGGIESPVFILLGIVFIMSAMVLPFKHSLFVFLSGGAAYITDIWLEYYRIIPHIHIFKIFGANAFQDTAYILTFSMIIVFVFAGMAILTGYLTRVLDAQVKEISQAKAHSDSLVKDMEKIKATLEDSVKERTTELEESMMELTNTKTATLNILEDVNNTKEELIQAKEYIESVINSLIDPMVTTDIRGIITSFREGVQEFLGYKSEDMIGRHISLVYRDGKEEAKRIMKVLEKDGRLKNYETIFVSKDGMGISSLLSASFLRDAEGRITGTLGIAKDISDRKRLEEELRHAKDFLETTLESITDPFVTTDRRGIVTSINKGMTEVFGYNTEDIIGRHISMLYPGGMGEAKKLMGLLNEQGVVRNYETQFIKKDGTLFYAIASVSLMRNDRGEVIGTLGICKDITDRKRLEEELRRAKDFLESVVENSVDGITVLDRSGNITFITKGAEEMLGYDRKNIHGAHISKYYLGGMEEAKKIMRSLREEGKLGNYETALKSADGRIVPISVSASPLRDDKGEIVGTLGVYKDITENKRLEKELEKLSITDSLTGLYNQRHFYNELKREVERAKRLYHPLSLLLFDIDGFKYYNDTYGHLEGDKALNKVGRVVSESIRVNVDSGYRYGGDEFVVILPETNTNKAFPIAERIRTSFNTAGLVDVTLSIGLIEYRTEYDLETFVRHADKAMYTAKQSGGDRINVYE